MAALFVNGYKNKEAAESLGQKENSLRWHIKNLNRKFGAADWEGSIKALKSIKIVRE